MTTQSSSTGAPESGSHRAEGIDLKGTVAAGVTVFLWASAFVVIRDSVEDIDPGGLAFGRMAVAALALLGLVLWRKEGLPPRAAWPGILGSGILWLTIYMVALNWGEQKVDAGTAALVVGVGPILIALLSGWLLGEGYSPRLFGGILIALAGTAVVGFSMSDEGGASVIGVLLCVVAAIGFAGGMVAQKFALRHASALQITAYGCIVAAVATAPFAFRLADDVSASAGSTVASMVYLGLFPTALAFTTWAYALSRIPAGKLSVTTYVVPALTVGVAWLFLGELPTLIAAVGGALCLGGVMLSRSRPGALSARLRSPRPAAATLQPAGSIEAAD